MYVGNDGYMRCVHVDMYTEYIYIYTYIYAFARKSTHAGDS